MMIQAPFLERAKAEAERRGLAIATLSNKLFGEAVTLPRMLAGGSCTVRKFEIAEGRLTEMEAEQLSGEAA